jgi:hypothetical protein
MLVIVAWIAAKLTVIRQLRHHPSRRTMATMPEDEKALTVLRGIWTAQRQSAADITPGSGKVCRNMKNIGFGGVDEGGSTAGPVDDDQRVAWRERLAREGKVAPGSTTLRELLLGEGPGS